jgi:methylated-DNA-[protein]-cysteine S-methyltransferase
MTVPANLTSYDVFQDALGFAAAVVRDGCLVGLGHSSTREGAEGYLRHWPVAVHDPAADPLPAVRRQLDEYLAGERRDFDLPLAPAGTEFQRLCWDELLRIPYGETRTYGELGRTTTTRSASSSPATG